MLLSCSKRLVPKRTLLKSSHHHIPYPSLRTPSFSHLLPLLASSRTLHGSLRLRNDASLLDNTKPLVVRELRPRVEDVLPICCPGCGAYSQTVEPNEPGYYNRTRKQVRRTVRLRSPMVLVDEEASPRKEEEGKKENATDNSDSPDEVEHLTIPKPSRMSHLV